MAKTFTCKSEYSSKNDATVRVADCRKFLPCLPTSSAQLVLTSPPYNVGKAYERQRKELDDYISLQREAIRESVRILQDGGSLCWQVGNYVIGQNEIIPLDLLLWPIFSDLIRTSDLHLRNRIVWHYEHGLHYQHRFSGRHEVILWFTKGDNYRFRLDRVRIPQKYPGKRAYKGPRKGEFSGNPMGKNPGDVWSFPNVKANHIEKTLHPCQFPIELAERLVLSMTDPGDLVVDPFAGVGSALVAALLHGRRAAGSDIESKYIAIARTRMRAAFNGLLRYRSYQRPPYVPTPNCEVATAPVGFSNYSATG